MAFFINYYAFFSIWKGKIFGAHDLIIWHPLEPEPNIYITYLLSISVM